jgi:hypothetical protein
MNEINDIWMALWASVALGDDGIRLYIDASKHE